MCIGFYASWGTGKSFAMNKTEDCTKMMHIASMIDAYATDTDQDSERAKAAEKRLKVHPVPSPPPSVPGARLCIGCARRQYSSTATALFTVAVRRRTFGRAK